MTRNTGSTIAYALLSFAESSPGVLPSRSAISGSACRFPKFNLQSAYSTLGANERDNHGPWCELAPSRSQNLFFSELGIAISAGPSSHPLAPSSQSCWISVTHASAKVRQRLATQTRPALKSFPPSAVTRVMTILFDRPSQHCPWCTRPDWLSVPFRLVRDAVLAAKTFFSSLSKTGRAIG